MLWGCPSLIESGSANHHPQKKHLPRQAEQAHAFKYTLNQTFSTKKLLIPH